MAYFFGKRAGLYIILMMAALETVAEITGGVRISQARAEQVVLGGPSCNLALGQDKRQEKKCNIASDSLKQATIVADLFSVLPTLAQLEQFRVLNENFRQGLEEDRRVSEQKRISSGELFTPAYLRDMEAYKKGVKLYHIRAKSYQKGLARLNKNSLKSVVAKKGKPYLGRHKSRQRLVRQERDKEFPYFSGAE